MLKKLFVTLFCALLVFSISPKTGFAEATADDTVSGTVTSSATDTGTADTSVNVDPSAATDPANATGDTTAAPSDDQVKEEAGITPDSFLYSLEQMIESVQLALTFNQEGKAELLIQFANERLAEAQVINAKNQSQLVEKVLHSYITTVERANSICQTTLDQDNADSSAGALLDKIEVLQNDGEKVAIQITGSLPQEQSQEIMKSIEAQVKITLASKAFAAVKNELVNSVHEVAQAKQELDTALKSGDQTAIQAAQAKVQETEQYRDQVAQLKKDVREFKKDIKKEQLEVLKEQKKELMKNKKEIPKEPNDPARLNTNHNMQAKQNTDPIKDKYLNSKGVEATDDTSAKRNTVAASNMKTIGRHKD
ncbi:MAG: hypothetical protein AWM53_00977 [Candidatus Dichloromethanomonas elyunquensis]|nr:MAG: hypothetical protein AWM53_00977 [Candidatus Dichloromethanomonas elyunquensis]